LGFFIAWPVFAANVQVPIDRTVFRIHNYSNYAVVRYTPAFTNSLGCGGSVQNDSAVIDFQSNKDNKTMLMMVLSAKLLGLKIGFGINDNCHGWSGGVPRVYRVDLE